MTLLWWFSLLLVSSALSAPLLERALGRGSVLLTADQGIHVPLVVNGAHTGVLSVTVDVVAPSGASVRVRIVSDTNKRTLESTGTAWSLIESVVVPRYRLLNVPIGTNPTLAATQTFQGLQHVVLVNENTAAITVAYNVRFTALPAPSTPYALLQSAPCGSFTKGLFPFSATIVRLDATGIIPVQTQRHCTSSTGTLLSACPIDAVLLNKDNFANITDPSNDGSYGLVETYNVAVTALMHTFNVNVTSAPMYIAFFSGSNSATTYTYRIGGNNAQTEECPCGSGASCTGGTCDRGQFCVPQCSSLGCPCSASSCAAGSTCTNSFCVAAATAAPAPAPSPPTSATSTARSMPSPSSSTSTTRTSAASTGVASVTTSGASGAVDTASGESATAASSTASSPPTKAAEESISPAPSESDALAPAGPLPDTAIIGIAVAASVLLILLAGVVVFLVCRRSRSKSRDADIAVDNTGMDQFFAPPTIRGSSAVAAMPPPQRTSSHEVLGSDLRASQGVQAWAAAPNLAIDMRTSSHDALLSNNSAPTAAMPTLMPESFATMATMNVQQVRQAQSTWDVDL
jgi:hypothetical protein